MIRGRPRSGALLCGGLGSKVNDLGVIALTSVGKATVSAVWGAGGVAASVAALASAGGDSRSARPVSPLQQQLELEVRSHLSLCAALSPAKILCVDDSAADVAGVTGVTGVADEVALSILDGSSWRLSSWRICPQQGSN